jgi:hypothetical protein
VACVVIIVLDGAAEWYNALGGDGAVFAGGVYGGWRGRAGLCQKPDSVLLQVREVTFTGVLFQVAAVLAFLLAVLLFCGWCRFYCG